MKCNLFLLVFFLLCCSAFGQTAFSKIGILRQIVIESEPVTYQYLLETEDGNRYTVDSETPLEKYRNRRVEVTGISENNRLQVSHKIEAITEKEAAMPPPSPTIGSRKVLVLLLNFTNQQAQPVTTEQVRSRVFTSSLSANAFFKENAFHRYSLTGIQRADGDVVGWLTLPSTNENCANSIYSTWVTQSWALARNNGFEPNNYQSVMYVFSDLPQQTETRCIVASANIGNLGSQTGAFGSWYPHARETFGGNIIVPHNNYSTVAHEIGHNLGLAHANAYACTGPNIPANCQNREYGDTFDKMGQEGGVLFNNYSRLKLGWLAGKHTNVNVSGSYNLYTPSIPSKGNHVLQIPLKDAAGNLNGLSIFLEFRRKYGFDLNDPQRPLFMDGVLIRYANSDYSNYNSSYLIDTTPDSSLHFYDARLTAGNTYTDSFHGVTITTTRVSFSLGTRVQITLSR